MLDLPNIFLSITAVCNIGLAIFINRRNRKSPTGFFFALFTIFLAFWAIALIGYSIVDDHFVALYLMKASYVSALIIGVGFYFFSIVYPNEKEPSKLHQFVITALLLAFIIPLFFFSTFFTKFIVEHPWGKETILGLPEYCLFVGLFSFLFVGGLIRTWVKVLRSVGIIRIRLLFVALSVTFAGLLGMYFNLYLPSPFLQDFRYIWSGPLFTFFIATTIVYSIFRFKLFDVRVITAELFTFALWMFILVQTLLAPDPKQQITNALLLIATIIIGIFLIRSVNKEVDSREKLEVLAKKLQTANSRLRELDRQKSEFLSIATHQLRGPLAGIRGHLSLIIDGSYGKMPARAKEVIEKIFFSSGLLTQTINDFLDVSRIEQGSMQYDMKTFECDSLVKEVVEELQPLAKERNLKLSFADECDGQCTVHADYAKLRHIFFNLVDNATKYTEKGWIKATVKKDPKKKILRVEISDSGIGIGKDEIAGLFEKFVRARGASGINIHGTGLGLYVAREMVEVHKGKIWAESEGKGKGSTFVVELPTSSTEARKTS